MYSRESSILEEKSSNNLNTKIYDYAIVGGGVAGVFTAEALSRSGKSVLLIEKDNQIATESSGEQHGWAQFGSLYFNMMDAGVAEDCLKNVSYLLDDYLLPGNNLTVKDGQLISENPNCHENWYTSQPIYHYLPEPDYVSLKLSSKEKEQWESKLQNILVRTKAVSEHHWGSNKLDGILKHADELKEGNQLYLAKKAAKKWMKKCEKHHSTGLIAERMKKDRVINVNTDHCMITHSHDRTMRSTRILTSVHQHYELNGGKTIFNINIDNHSVGADGNVELTATNGTKYQACKVVYAAGSGLNDVKGSNVKTVLSPLLVVSPAICPRNLVYLTPRQKYTINHIYHVDPSTGKSYSVIGNGDGINPGDDKAIEASRENLIRQAEQVFPELSKTPSKDKNVYFGHKTEFKKDEADRNYHYAFAPIHSDKIWSAIPGKFTLAPSLAHHIYTALEGTKPPKLCIFPKEEDEYKKLLNSELDVLNVAPELHRQIVTNAVTDISKRGKRNKLHCGLFKTKQIINHLEKNDSMTLMRYKL